jgi:hypothetical protein
MKQVVTDWLPVDLASNIEFQFEMLNSGVRSRSLLKHISNTDFCEAAIMFEAIFDFRQTMRQLNKLHIYEPEETVIDTFWFWSTQNHSFIIPAAV